MKLSKKVKAKNRYLLKVDVFKDDNAFLTMEQWLFPE